MCKPILVFSLSLSQAEQKVHSETKTFQPITLIIPKRVPTFPNNVTVSKSISRDPCSIQGPVSHQLRTCMDPYGPVWSRMVLYGLVWSGMVRYGPVWSRMVQYSHIWSCMVHFSCMVPYCSIWSHMVLYGLVWSSIVTYCLVWSRMVPYGPIRSRMVS